jgi:hypothetical protein
MNPISPKVQKETTLYRFIYYLGKVKKVGESDRKAVEEHYSWYYEEKKLFDIYEKVLYA